MRKLIKTDRNGTKYWDESNCPKCGGKGKIYYYAHVEGGICFKCGGTGVFHHKIIERNEMRYLIVEYYYGWHGIRNSETVIYALPSLEKVWSDSQNFQLRRKKPCEINVRLTQKNSRPRRVCCLSYANRISSTSAMQTSQPRINSSACFFSVWIAMNSRIRALGQ